MARKAYLIQCQGLTGEKRTMAFAAFRPIPQPLGGDSVDAITVGTDDM
jgi:hypothetical protein